MNRRRSAGPRRDPDDRGFTLIEVTVTMGIMSVMLVIFTTAILQVYRSVLTTESLSTAQSQLQIAFQRFDREVRYASWIAEPGRVGTTWYVEYAASDPTQCRQLRFETPATPTTSVNARGVLQLIRWTRGTPPAAGCAWPDRRLECWSPEAPTRRSNARPPGRRPSWTRARSAVGEFRH